MVHQESLNCNIPIFVYDARLDLVRDDFVSGLVRGLAAVESNINIRAISFEQMFGHRIEPLWAGHLEWVSSLQRPRGQDQVRITGSVIRMQMREKSPIEFLRPQPLDAVSKRGCCAPDNALAKVRRYTAYR